MNAMYRWAIIGLLLSLQRPVVAGTITLSSAQMGPAAQGYGVPASASSFVGWRFQVSKTTAVTQVGGHLGALQGNMFAAIISLSSIDALPQGAPFAEGVVKASATFTPPTLTAEFSTPLSVTLQPGAYALIFGSGQFGATGSALVPYEQQPNIAPTTATSYLSWRETFQNYFSWSVGYVNNVRFTVVGVETAGPADFNLDGNVDGADLSIWKGHFGTATTGGVANGDADGDGKVDGADFLAWQRGFAPPAAVPSAVQAIPEPSSIAIALFMFACCSRSFRNSYRIDRRGVE